ncbi:MAG: response regulator [Eubacterium sp.]|nr:response regulator [Eubacterium sp.]
MAKTNGRVAIIRNEDGLVVGSVSKELIDNGITPIYAEYSPRKIAMISDMADMFILLLEGTMAEMIEITESIRDLAKSQNKMFVGIGERVDNDFVKKNIAGFAFDAFYERPVNASAFVSDMLKYLEKGKAAGKTKKKILIVDDDAYFAGVLRDWLKDQYQVAVVTDGTKAISHLLKRPMDLVLLDYQMPVASGAQVFEMMKADAGTRKIPVIFLTGVDDTESVKHVISLKPEGYLLKSISKEQLLERLQQFFEKH